MSFCVRISCVWSCSVWRPVADRPCGVGNHDSETPEYKTRSWDAWAAQRSDNSESRVVWPRHKALCFTIAACCRFYFSFQDLAQNLGQLVYLLSCKELDDKIDTTWIRLAWLSIKARQHPCLFVGLSAGWRKNYATDFHETWMEDESQSRIDPID